MNDEDAALVAAYLSHAETKTRDVEALAWQDPRFRRALRGAWGWNRMAPDVRKRLDDLVRD
jgi:hypothetical protein